MRSSQSFYSHDDFLTDFIIFHNIIFQTHTISLLLIIIYSINCVKMYIRLAEIKPKIKFKSDYDNTMTLLVGHLNEKWMEKFVCNLYVRCSFDGYLYYVH